MRTIFLDRDGVINENRDDYVKSWDEFQFLTGAREAIAHLTQAGYRIVVCSNQAAIAKGLVTIQTVEEIHHRMITEVAKVGGTIERVYYCPHGNNEHCICRKPRPGMLLQARDELGLDLRDAIFIGDSFTDIQAAITAGVFPILVLSGLGMEQIRTHHQDVDTAFCIASNLGHAVQLIQQGLYVRRSLYPLLEQAHFVSHGLSRDFSL